MSKTHQESSILLGVTVKGQRDRLVERRGTLAIRPLPVRNEREDVLALPCPPDLAQELVLACLWGLPNMAILVPWGLPRWQSPARTGNARLMHVPTRRCRIALRTTIALVVGWLALACTLLKAGDAPDSRGWTWRQPVVWRDLPLHGPLVQLELLNRDRLSGEMLKLGDATVELRTAGGCLLQFPRLAVLSVGQSTRWDVMEFRPGTCGETGSPCRFEDLPPRGRLTGWLQTTTAGVARPGVISLGTWTSPLDGTASRRPHAYHRLMFDWNEERVRLYLDGALLADEPAPVHRAGLSVQPAERMTFRDVVLTQPRARPSATLRPLDQPLVALDDGSELAAATVRLVDGELELTADGAAARWNWSSWQAIAWPAPAEPVPAHPVSGWLVELELQPLTESPGEPPDRLTGAITRLDAAGFRLQHALLGSLPLRWRDVRSLTLRGWGTATPLRLGPVHLGDEIRDDLRSPLPLGDRLSGLFPWKPTYSRRMWLELDHADLEPAGPATPPASPFLAELRAGQLVTQLLVNQIPLGTINEHLRWKASPSRPERLAIPLRAGLLQPGANSWELRERPQQAGSGYDDWELWNLMLYEAWP